MPHLRTGSLLMGLFVFAGCGPSITINRLAPAPYNLGPVRTLVLVEARGARGQLDRFAAAFVANVRGAGYFQLVDARAAGVRLGQLAGGDAVPAARDFRRRWPADIYLAVHLTSCNSYQRSETYTERPRRGPAVVKTRYWAEAQCEAEVDFADGRDGRDLGSGEARGRGSSTKFDDWRSGLANDAVEEALEGAVANAVALFTPRRVSEAIYLEPKAPAGAPGIEKIEAGRYPEARALWESALQSQPDSPPLNYNLGVVCEALGDTNAARVYYQRAIAFAPGERRYREALDLLEQRLHQAEALRTRR